MSAVARFPLRVGTTWAVLSLLAALAARGGGAAVDATPPVVLAAGAIAWGAVTGFGVRTSLTLLGLRKGAARIDPTAPVHRLHALAPLGVVVGALGAIPAAAYALTVDGGGGARFTVVAAAGAGAALAAAIVFRAAPAIPRATRTTRAARFIVVDTALPAGLLSTCAGGLLGALHHASFASMPTTALVHWFAVSVAVAAACVGFAGVVKAASELRSGAVIVEDPPRASMVWPGLIEVALLSGVVLLAAGPHVLPLLPPTSLVFVKAACGFVAGTLAAAAGARDAVVRVVGRRD